MKILVAVEDPGAAAIVADYACDKAKLANAQVKILNVIPSLFAYTSLAVVPELLDDMRRESRHNAGTLVHEIAERLAKECPTAVVEEQIAEGSPAETILSVASQWDADLIIIGSHGRRGLNRLVLGSVSMAVVGAAECPVLVVKTRGNGTTHVDKGSEQDTSSKDKGHPVKV
ncbi:MAG: universal stress protein [Cyanobacteria bacterium SZAS LIN-2]|nr:universal stress protein [Cyanobacteria bacterium SZAS LIN-2]MBS2006253.1 universal stress protein [Cyanobacteria bacterium SZAS TMP-1]